VTRTTSASNGEQSAPSSEVTTHSFRKTIATLIDDAGLSARIGADHLGHAKVSMTQDRYMSRGRVHPQVAELLEQTVGEPRTLNAD
jgi:integrase